LAIAAAYEVVTDINSQKRETLAERLKTLRDFEYEMRQRDEASRQWYNTLQEYPDLCPWYDAPDPLDE